MPIGRRDRTVEGEATVPASIEEVWRAWTTKAGAESFFAPRCEIDLRSGGKYEMIFDPEAAPGKRGSEGAVLLAVQPPAMLSFTWNAPPELPEIRTQRTHVTVRLEKLGASETRVTLRHDGWGEGDGWDAAYEHFQRAWKRIVLPRLRYRFEHGPVDWSNPPNLPPARGD
ncbi:MAG: SRPBCC domain-containing protein [Anaerolineales bacterium]|nr:SRPBCC domain-containing protein [Anaerolineales bacterium]